MKLKKKSTYFAFQTRLSPQILLERLPKEIEEYNILHEDGLRYRIPKGGQNRFHIGLLRDGHGDGYWYCGTITENDQGCQITGRIVRNPDENDMAEKGPLGERIIAGIWNVIWAIPSLLVMAGAYIYLLVKRIPRDPPKEEKLITLMTVQLPCHLTAQR